MGRAFASIVVVLSVVGCAAAPITEPDEARLELGTGTWRFEPVADGDELPLVKGAQGGWHVWVAVRAHGLESGVGSLEIELQPADESEPPQRTRLGVQLDPPDDEGGRSYLGWPAILPDPSCAVGRLLRVHATLTTPSGERFEDEREIVPGPGEDPPPACANGDAELVSAG